jgi:phospholipase C
MPGLSVAEDAPIASEIPIDNVVVLMLENRSFDHLLSDLASVGQTDADVAPADASNPDPSGQPVARHRIGAYCFEDTNHEWQGSHEEWNGGKNDGFARVNATPGDPSGSRAMSWFGAADLPFLYGLAGAYAIGDRYFASVMGPTDPNRSFLYAGSSFGRTGSGIIGDQVTTLFDALDRAHVSWAEYHEDVPPSAVLIDSFARHFNQGVYPEIASFYDDAAHGRLPHVSFVDAKEQGTASRDDDHPPGDPQVGDQLISRVVGALTSSPQWPHLVLFVVFDEHGGLYDHVPPPSACPPDAIAPMGDALGYGFDRLGFRVPLIVVSPYARRHFVSHVVHDHTSIVRFIETRFSIPALSARDANADPMLELFDFAHPETAPAPLPDAGVDQSKLDECRALFPEDAGGVDAGVGD